MSKVILKKVIDVNGVELTPGEPVVCLGNGEQGFECCCDECDYYLLCFPEFNSLFEEEEKDRAVFGETFLKKGSPRALSKNF